MLITPCSIPDVFEICLEKKSDDRGFLARIFDKNEFLKNGLTLNIEEGYITNSINKGTLRGFHYSKDKEKKLTKVINGSIYQVVVDLRKKSKTYKKWQSFIFKSTDYKMLLIGPGIANAILTLVDNTELMTLYTPSYNPKSELGISFNDPSINVKWPIPIKYISQKDLSWSKVI